MLQRGCYGVCESLPTPFFPKSVILHKRRRTSPLGVRGRDGKNKSEKAFPFRGQGQRRHFKQNKTMHKIKNPIERTMFYGATPLIFERAKMLRENPTKAEKALWDILRKKQMLGLRFKQQHPINIFIVDFYCHAIKLVIEVDGEIHKTEENKEYDQARTDKLENYGIKVIRFDNHQVLKQIENVKNEIERICKNRLDL